MERVLIFGNTPESRRAARMFRQRGRHVVMSVTSEYARSLLPPGIPCHVGKLDGDAMVAYIRKVNPHRIVDATHPYAVTASQNILRAAALLGLPCEQVPFENSPDAWREAVEWVTTPVEMLRALNRETCNVLLGIGSDPINDYGPGVDLRRLYPRIAPIPHSVAECLRIGFPPENIIAMQAPFSKALTMALFDEKNIGAVVVKDATDSNFLHEMVIPALERGAHVIMYSRKDG